MEKKEKVYIEVEKETENGVLNKVIPIFRICKSIKLFYLFLFRYISKVRCFHHQCEFRMKIYLHITI